MLDSLPRVDRLHLASVTKLPDWHPALPNGSAGYDVFGYLIHHPAGPILVDTGIGVDSALIDELYEPSVVPLADALRNSDVGVEDLVAVVNTHLHFDHCGQNSATPAPCYVQRAEVEAAKKPRYTVPEWASIAEDRRRQLDGEAEIADGVVVVPTPGHTPGHQSVLLESTAGRAVIVGQAAWHHVEWNSGTADEGNAASLEVAQRSLNALRALDPRYVYFAHDSHMVTTS